MEQEAMARVVLIEDDDLNRRLIAYLLRKVGDVEVVDFADGEKALAYLRTGVVVHTIVIDFQLPQITGKEVVKEIRTLEHLQQTPVIVLTAYLMPREKFLEMGFTDYMPKPIENDNFIKGIKKYIV